MIRRADNRFASAGWRRVVATVLVLSWVNVSAQPCLMALDPAPDSTVVTEHSGHAGHAAPDHDTMPCDHCPPAGDTAGVLCANGINSSCGESPDFSTKTRKADFQFKGDDFGSALPSLPEPSANRDAATHGVVADTGLLKNRSGPTLSIRYCVFLK